VILDSFLDDYILPSRKEILVCDGAIKACEAEQDGGLVPYEDGAIVPCGDWHSPAGIEDLTPTRVFAVRLPNAVLFPIRELDMSAITCQAEADEVASGARYRAAVAAFAERLARFTEAPATISILGISAKLPGLTTVTVDPKKQRRIGLHLDVWDRLSLNQKSRARWRINVNLGSESRYLIFCNLPVPEMHSRAAMDARTVGTAIGRKFFERFPSYPLLRLTVQPGEGYVAPTDLLIHDATTLDKTTPDISIAVLGHFRLTCVQAARQR
jgi:hypothetical protein